MNFLKNHPFAVEAHFERSLVLTFALPKERLVGLTPEVLELDLFEDKWAFFALAMVQTKRLRPKGFAKWLGSDFFLIGCRVFVRYQSIEGRSLRGLYILRSETDKGRMQFFGNLFTHYNYRKTDIAQSHEQSRSRIFSVRSALNVEIDRGAVDTPLPNGSPFADWQEARKFAGPLPHTFTYDEEEKKMLIIKGLRKNWQPKPVQVIEYDIGFLEEFGLEGAVLANAFEVRGVDYCWEKGRIESWR